MTLKNARVVFFGTPELATPMLKELCEQATVVACVTQPDKPRGRSLELTPSPVKLLALRNGIPVLQPKTLKREKPSGEDFYQAFTALRPDVAVVVAYGKIIPQDYLVFPQYGFVNVHPSLLPELRGPSPIQYALLEGKQTTGISIMKLDAGMDTGPILAQEEFALDKAETAETLHDRVQLVGTSVLIRALTGYLAGDIHPKPQDDSRATYSHRIEKTDGEIDWSQAPEYIERKIRAYTSWPGAYTFCGDKRIKILRAHCEGNAVVIDQVQPEGKKPMSYADFFRGHPECALPPR